MTKTIVIFQAIVLFFLCSIASANSAANGIFDIIMMSEPAQLVSSCIKTPELCRTIGEKMFDVATVAGGQHSKLMWLGQKAPVLGISALLVGAGTFAVYDSFQRFHELKEFIESTTTEFDDILAEIDALNSTAKILLEKVSKLWLYDYEPLHHKEMEKTLKMIKVTIEGIESVTEKVSQRTGNFTLATKNCRWWTYATTGGTIATAIIGYAYPPIGVGAKIAAVAFGSSTLVNGWSWWKAKSQEDIWKDIEISFKKTVRYNLISIIYTTEKFMEAHKEVPSYVSLLTRFQDLWNWRKEQGNFYENEL